MWKKWESGPTSDSSMKRSSGTLKAPCKLIRAVLMPIAVKRSVPTLRIFRMSETQSMKVYASITPHSLVHGSCEVWLWVRHTDIET